MDLFLINNLSSLFCFLCQRDVEHGATHQGQVLELVGCGAAENDVLCGLVATRHVVWYVRDALHAIVVHHNRTRMILLARRIDDGNITESRAFERRHGIPISLL